MPIEVKNSAWDNRVAWVVVIMEHPFVCKVWLHMNHLFSDPLKNIFIKNSVDILPWRNKFCKSKAALIWSIICSFQLSLAYEKTSQCATHSLLCCLVFYMYKMLYYSYLLFNINWSLLLLIVNDGRYHKNPHAF